MYHYQAKILRWLDGDTCDVEIDLGFSITIHKRVRVYGINTPEVHSANPVEKQAGLRAKQFAETLAAPGSVVEARTHKEGEDDKFGRYLAVLTLPGGEDFSELMLENGHAVAYFGGKK